MFHTCHVTLQLALFMPFLQFLHWHIFTAFSAFRPTFLILQEKTRVMHPICVTVMPLQRLKQLTDFHKTEHQATKGHQNLAKLNVRIPQTATQQPREPRQRPEGGGMTTIRFLRSDRPHKGRSWNLSANWSPHSNKYFFGYCYQDGTQKLLKYLS
jgi:hypothetical protein